MTGFDANESNYLIKMIMTRYLDHPRDAHLFQCCVPNLNSISIKLGI